VGGVRCHADVLLAHPMAPLERAWVCLLRASCTLSGEYSLMGELNCLFTRDGATPRPRDILHSVVRSARAIEQPFVQADKSIGSSKRMQHTCSVTK
jgi:hypothetical protein